ncbi:MAG: hypothetical protein KatS3mg110_4401 [Pirellulaceae bacterium]|nr:MAG: hypothetical protein KatS3mg110_4401 [Pirellulaceae bacterium]
MKTDPGGNYWIAGLLGALSVLPLGWQAELRAQFGFGRSGVEDITFDDLKLDLKKDEPFVPEKLTSRVKELHGKLIRIRGWILPSSVFQQRGIKNFVLVRDNMECCFGPGAALYDCILVEMEDGKTADFTTRPVIVEGRFEHREFKYPDGKQFAIYYMRARSVR